MRIVVIGSSGQLGVDLMQELPAGGAGGHEAIGFSGRAELDICDAAAVASMLERVKPDAVINTAAFHNVDLCEKEADAAYRTNVIAVREMAKLCEAAGIGLFQIGTDYVVEGAPQNNPVPESAPVHPNSIYSLTRSAQRLHGALAPRPHPRIRRALLRPLRFCGLQAQRRPQFRGPHDQNGPRRKKTPRGQ